MRFTAARQIGEIAKSHPQDLNSLLSKVSQYLHSKKWIPGMLQLMGAITENVKHTSLTELSKSFEMKISEAGISGTFTDILTWPNRNPENSTNTDLPLPVGLRGRP
ncbi:unnamed protein product [Fraxinus pennsylvanica]|uniref:Uncharacterized protein n=1 Tax=Fraxinus pennsylvanica TaxID=56036 RepID=A0AAD2EEE0_9LAMI|nr:unnamed protein product [Fraxinus pennsylvanica]